MSPKDEHENKGPLVLGISILVTLLATTAVALRFLSRKVAKAHYWWDDWMTLAALPWTWGTNICQFYSYHNGLGQHIAMLPPDTLLKQEKVSFWFEIIYVVAIGFNKYSILLFYRRLFPRKSVLLILKMVALVVLAWQIAIIAGFIWQCRPVRKAWDVVIPGTCINVTQLWLGNAIPNIITDIIIIMIPLPLIWNLQLPSSQKLALCGIFLTGVFVCAVSFLRLIAILHVKPEDITWNYVPVAIWSAVEPSIGLVCACLPSMRCLFKKLTWSKHTTPKESSSNRLPTALSRVKSGKISHPLNDELEMGEFSRLRGDDGTYEARTTEAVAMSDVSNELEPGVPLNAIHVQESIEQVRSHRT